MLCKTPDTDVLLVVNQAVEYILSQPDGVFEYHFLAKVHPLIRYVAH